MHVAIQKIGNKGGILILNKILEDTGLKEHDVVELTSTNQGIFIKKIMPMYKSLDEVFEGYEGIHKCEEWGFGEDVGRETVW